jgi:hypothetical protein
MCRRLLGSKPAILFSTKLRSTRGVRRVSVRSSKFFSRLLKLSELLGYPVDQCSSLLAPTTLEPRVATSTSCKMLQVANGGTAGLRQKRTFIWHIFAYIFAHLWISWHPCLFFRESRLTRSNGSPSHNELPSTGSASSAARDQRRPLLRSSKLPTHRTSHAFRLQKVKLDKQNLEIPIYWIGLRENLRSNPKIEVLYHII